MENDNQDQEEVKSYPILGEGKLWIRLKIPRDEVIKKADFENQIIGFDEKKDDDQNQMMKDLSKNFSRVCHICHKAFSSGKALGGHMRIHVQKEPTNKFKKLQNTFNNGGLCCDDDIIKEPIICMICRRDFRSLKSLYGHMRCHPDRDWRGINPPPEILNSSFSSLSARKTDNDQDHTENEAVDLKECVKGWQVTAKRGRKALMAESKSEFSTSDDHQAVNYLMMLAQGNYRRPPEIEEKALEKRVLEGGPVKKLDDFDRLDFESAELKEVVKINGKKRKTMSLCDLKSARKVSIRVTPADQENDKYKCTTCGKLFSCHQALGGHRSSHRDKLKIVILDSVGKSGDVFNPTAPLMDEEIEKGRSNSVEVTRNQASERMLDFDLNELPPSDDEAGSSLNYLAVGNNCDNYTSLFSNFE